MPSRVLRTGAMGRFVPSVTARPALAVSVALGLLLAALPTVLFAAQDGGRPSVVVAEVRGVINPVVAGYVGRVIDAAEASQAAAVVLMLDTPGGLDTSMRQITQRLLAAQVPVAVFVYPAGARAGSAGVFITYAGHVAAMAPSTNIGSAHPVLIGDGPSAESTTMMDKVTNDAVATIRSLAETRGRNIEWAEQAVRESANLPASEALRLNVVDYLAADVSDLLRQMDGRTTRLGAREVVISTRTAEIQQHPMNPIERFFHAITDPTIAYLLLSIGGLALVYELASPGAILPGVVGGIALLLALFALGTLPVNMAGVGLILFAMLLFLADVAVAGSGVLTVGAILSFVLGSLLLATSPESQAYARVPLSVVGATSVAFAGFFTVAVAVILRSRRRTTYLGREPLLGGAGLARTDIGREGTVWVAGEMWQAAAEDPEHPIPEGSRVRVVAVEGLRLKVKPEQPPSA